MQFLLLIESYQPIEGQIRLAAPSEKVHTLIRITQLDRVLPVTDTVEHALAELGK